MSTCDKCLFWPSSIGESELPSSTHDHRPCLNSLVNGEYNHVIGNDSAISYNSIGTGPKFGCIHFIQKEES